MKIFIDLNILLEIFFERPNTETHEIILDNNEVHMSTFSLYSLMIILQQKKRSHVLQHINRYFEKKAFSFHTIHHSESEFLMQFATKHNLDIDDAMQLYLANKLGIPLVTLDKDFKALQDLFDIQSPEDILYHKELTTPPHTTSPSQ